MINNGSRVRLVIDGVFEGEAGVQGNQLAFIPNRSSKPVAQARGGLLDGAPVLLTIRTSPATPICHAIFKRLS